MKKNMGIVDKVIRVIIGLAAIGLGIYYENWLGALGVIPLLTVVINTCPLYSALGISTKKSKDVEAKTEPTTETEQQ